MLDRYKAVNENDANGMPVEGTVEGEGLNITWQNGPLSRDGERLPPNGAFVETVIAAAKQRIEYYNSTEFKCLENTMAIEKLNDALSWLNKRTQEREERGVEGTHQK